MQEFAGGEVGFAGTALAHPGHGATDPQTVTHYTTEPVHTAPLLIIITAAAGLSLLAARRRDSRRP